MPRSVFVTGWRHCGHWFLSASQVAMQALQNLCPQCRVHRFLFWMCSWQMLQVISISCRVVIFKPGLLEDVPAKKLGGSS